MASIEDLKAKLHQIRDQLPSYLLEAATSVSLTGKALAERTIKDKGFGATYSLQEVPVWFFSGKELNASGKAYIETKQGKGKKKKKKLENITEADLYDGMGTWKEFREAQGLQTGHVDLTFSGKMWAGMFPREAYQNGNLFIAPLGHNNKEGQNEMNWNRDRYGDFVGKALTGDNYKIMADIGVQELMRLIVERNNL